MGVHDDASGKKSSGLQKHFRHLVNETASKHRFLRSLHRSTSAREGSGYLLTSTSSGLAAEVEPEVPHQHWTPFCSLLTFSPLTGMQYHLHHCQASAEKSCVSCMLFFPSRQFPDHCPPAQLTLASPVIAWQLLRHQVRAVLLLSLCPSSVMCQGEIGK